MKLEIARILRESSHAILKITTRERTSNIALNQDYLKSVDKIKGFSEADKQQVREIFSKNLEQGRGMRGSAKDLEKAFPDMERKRAEMIARTGHTEIRNLAENEKYKEKGFNSFTVDSTAEACDECNETYQNYVFSMDDVDMLPPLHPHCMCVAIYHEETPEEYADLNGLEVYGGDSGTVEPQIDYTNDQISNYLSEEAQNFVDEFKDKRGKMKLEYGQRFEVATGKSGIEYRGTKTGVNIPKLFGDASIHNHPASGARVPSPQDVVNLMGDTSTKSSVIVSTEEKWIVTKPEGHTFTIDEQSKAKDSLLQAIREGKTEATKTFLESAEKGEIINPRNIKMPDGKIINVRELTQEYITKSYVNAVNDLNQDMPLIIMRWV